MTDSRRIFLGLGECMVELAPSEEGSFRQGFAGDVFNTLWYAARMLRPDWQVQFQTALGRDALSDELIAFAEAAGVACRNVARLEGAMPGLYMIRLQAGERRFLYWRGQSAARRLMDDPARVADAMGSAALVYLSGITLAILPPDGRAALIGLMTKARMAGTPVAFDPNIRPALWESPDALRQTITAAAAAASIVLPSFDDEASAFGDTAPEETAARYQAGGASLVVVKNGPEPVTTQAQGGLQRHDTPPLGGPVRDSTAAGDAFNAAFLADYLRARDICAAVRAGQTLAARVVQGRGALVAPE